ncbi:MAG TPA: class I adenylate-forming enzyme family protein [Alphaproteobacteria bacterium]|nr:class I adenylate-forming enzyme family protein [Alphaproteobacteria bacterium]
MGHFSTNGNIIAALPEVAAKYRADGWWSDERHADRIRKLAKKRPNDPAYITETARFTWKDYDQASERVAAALLELGLQRGDRVAVVLPDGPAVHAALVGVEKAGLVAVGIGARAGDRELSHLLTRTAARALITHEVQRGRPASELKAAMADQGAVLEHLVLVPDFLSGEKPILIDGKPATGTGPVPPELGIGPDELFLLNSTSGTTGLPKCVMHTPNRWYYFHKRAAISGQFKDDEIFMGAVPAPFGFGMWTAHFSPTIMGVPTVVMEKFDAHTALDLIEREKVTVLCCVSTQFIMLLNAQAERPRDLSSLRSMFTGGEAVPFERAAEFEEVTGAAVLQFYGSNETGLMSGTTAKDSRERRLRTAGRLVEEMNNRLFDPDTGEDITGTSTTGQPGCIGPATCLGYWNDEAGNKKLYAPSGHMLMGDIVNIDADGYLSVVGRTSDFIIRGGKNISAPAVEEEVGTHPAIALVAAVAAPDKVFGERVAVYVVPRQGMTVTLESITQHLNARGVSKEWFPEHLILVDELPVSSGGKTAKGDLKADIKRRFADQVR